MAKTFLVNFRVTAQEHERIKNAAIARGFPTITAFIRSFALERDLWLEKKVQEIFILVSQIRENQK